MTEQEVAVKKVPPAAWQRVNKVFALMLKQADEHNQWTGFTTHLFGEAGLSMPYYSATMNLLKEMGAIEQVRRGVAGIESIWQLKTDALDYQVFESVFTPINKEKYESKGVLARLKVLTQRVDNLESIIARLLTGEHESEEENGRVDT